MYTFTFKRGEHMATFLTDQKQKLMGDLMVEVQKDMSLGVFNFLSDEIEKLQKNELILKFVPTNDSVKKNIFRIHFIILTK